MIEREYKIFELPNGQKDITVIYNIKNGATLTTFMYSDVSAFEEWIKADFDKVLSGKSEYEEVSGNVCVAEITPLTTKIYNNMAENDEEYYNTCCEIETKELRKLIDEWCDKIRELKKEQTNE